MRFDAVPTPVYVRADADRLVQVVTNLLSNAIKFSSTGAEVSVGVESGPQTVRVLVRDHGPGIPDDFKPRVFERFAQADATDARQKGGTGLSLSIVKQIVTLLGGTVGFSDAAGGGTIFHVDLPRWDLAVDISPSEQEPASVLICDDDAAVAQAIAARLHPAGFPSEIALTAAEAFTKAANGNYRAILVDLKLPDRDGISLIQDLRAETQHQNTPIIVISAAADRGRDDIRSSSLDVLDWLNKPIDLRYLVEVLKRPLACSGLRRPLVLHIDDDSTVLGVVAETLAPYCDVVPVADLAEARAAMASCRFDLAVLDLMLSQSSGLELLPELRDREGNAMPVILYSARAANGTNAAQVQAVLTKSPQSLDHLIGTLRKYLADQYPADIKREVA
jgi:DNA-binding response OmpR family regulator